MRMYEADRIVVLLTHVIFTRMIHLMSGLSLEIEAACSLKTLSS